MGIVGLDVPFLFLFSFAPGLGLEGRGFSFCAALAGIVVQTPPQALDLGNGRVFEVGWFEACGAGHLGTLIEPSEMPWAMFERTTA